MSNPARPALVVPRHGLVRAAAFALITLTALWLSLWPARALSVDVGSVGSGDLRYLSGGYHAEAAVPGDPRTRTYRWTRGDALLSLPTGQTEAALFSATLYAAPQPTGRPLALSPSPST